VVARRHNWTPRAAPTAIDSALWRQHQDGRTAGSPAATRAGSAPPPLRYQPSAEITSAKKATISLRDDPISGVQVLHSSMSRLPGDRNCKRPGSTGPAPVIRLRSVTCDIHSVAKRAPIPFSVAALPHKRRFFIPCRKRATFIGLPTNGAKRRIGTQWRRPMGSDGATTNSATSRCRRRSARCSGRSERRFVDSSRAGSAGETSLAFICSISMCASVDGPPGRRHFRR
jgi:hypothetical protein